jgi:hypothetical protein
MILIAWENLLDVDHYFVATILKLQLQLQLHWESQLSLTVVDSGRVVVVFGSELLGVVQSVGNAFVVDVVFGCELLGIVQIVEPALAVDVVLVFELESQGCDG